MTVRDFHLLQGQTPFAERNEVGRPLTLSPGYDGDFKHVTSSFSLAAPIALIIVLRDMLAMEYLLNVFHSGVKMDCTTAGSAFSRPLP